MQLSGVSSRFVRPIAEALVHHLSQSHAHAVEVLLRAVIADLLGNRVGAM